ncbi:MAG TPA: DUF998 domain-containing protein [Thermoplasmata archaeon]|jgi:hypothetical membrane protein
MFESRPKAWYLRLSGTLLLIASLVAFLGIITAETLYPGYSTSENEISDLGATRPPDSIIEQPSSNIFSGSMIVTGIMITVAAYFVDYVYRMRLVSIPMILFGVGVLGVGVFNGSWGGIHATFALLTFVFGAISAIVAYKIESFPMRYLSVALGVISLFSLLSYMFMGDSGPLSALGVGGVERWVAYPILLWVLGFGGYLMGVAQLDRPNETVRP